MTDDALSRYRANRLIATMREKARQITETEIHADVDDCTECDDEQQTPVTAASPDDIIISGIAVPYETPTGDGRGVKADALSWDLENEGVPIIWDRQDGDHSGMTIGKVDQFVSDGGSVLAQARLFATSDPEAAAAVARVVELIEEGALGWSVMMDDEVIEATYSEPALKENEDGSVTIRHSRADEMSWIVSARLRHLALVDTPAFPGARPVLGPLPVNAAALATFTFPVRHFDKWASDELVPLQVTPEGRVWGHAAGDGCYRTGQRGGACQKYTKDTDPTMKNFHTGTVTLDNGAVIRVGNLTCASLHASPSMSHSQQRQHHENTSTVWARVVAWNDDKGRLCVSGSVVPGLDRTTLAQVAGTPLSAELWPVPGVRGLTLVGLQTVNTPAWPV